jgi:RNA polymerase sigma factor (sigma-70 family)
MTGKCGASVKREEGVEHEQMEFAEFYRTSRDGCLQAVFTIVADSHLAEDLVAESFARALVRWGKVSRHPAPAAWVVRTALNMRVSWWRKHRREVPLTAYEEGPPTHVADEGAIDADVLRAVRLLPRRQREVVALRVFLDLDAQQTAEALGISANTVPVHLFRALAHLRERFSDKATRVS